jgi:hypothetical protein
VSGGADCLFVNKKAFVKHCTVGTLQTIGEMVSSLKDLCGRLLTLQMCMRLYQLVSYPSRTRINQQLQRKIEWSQYKRDFIDDLVRRRQKEKSNKKQSKTTFSL